MNIISNCCLGAYFTRDILNEPYSNPFVWSWLNTHDICYVVQNYSNIFFSNFKLQIHNNEHIHNGSTFDIIVDESFTICYPHYELSINDAVTRRDDTNNMVYSNAIYEYVVEKYISRTKRLYIGNNRTPIFLLCDNRNGCGTFSENQVQSLAKQSSYKIVFCSFYNYDNYTSNYFLHINIDGNRLAEIISKHTNEILTFIKN